MKKTFYVMVASLLSLTLLPRIRQVFNDVNYPPLSDTVRYIYLCLFAFTFVAFGVFLFMENKKNGVGISFNEKILIAFLMGIIFVMVAPVFSIDFHCYSIQGRVMSVHHANPYLITPDTFPDDPFLKGIFWTHRVTFYGPLWVLISVVMTFFAGNSVFMNLILLKLPMLAGYLLLIWQGYSLASKIVPKRKDIVATFLAFNPFIIVQYLMDGHNDILMFALAVWAFNLVYDRKYIYGYVIFTLSVLVKYVSVLSAPFLLLLLLSRLERKKDIIKNISSFFLIFVSITCVLYLPFTGGGITVFKTLMTHKLFLGAQGMDTNTLPYTYLFIVQKIGLLKGTNIVDPPPGIMNLFHFIAILSVVFMLVRGCKHNSDTSKLMSAVAGVFMVYFAFEAFSFGAWFLIWLLPFLLLSNMKNNVTLAYLLSIAGALAFWKRLSFLIIGCIFVYFVILTVQNHRRKAILA